MSTMNFNWVITNSTIPVIQIESYSVSEACSQKKKGWDAKAKRHRILDFELEPVLV